MIHDQAFRPERNTVGAEKIVAKKRALEVHLPDTRGVTISRYGRGNLKIGMGVYTYSRIPGRNGNEVLGTCPGATTACMSICYAFRIKDGSPDVWNIYRQNSLSPFVPPLPPDAKLVRIHISGDFDTPDYIRSWETIVALNPQTTFWAYTRSWRVPELLPYLETLRSLPNIQLFASMDQDCGDPPDGWRRSWLAGDLRGEWRANGPHTFKTASEVNVLTCPEEEKRVENCEACGYCFKAKRGDVRFLIH